MPYDRIESPTVNHEMPTESPTVVDLNCLRMMNHLLRLTMHEPHLVYHTLLLTQVGVQDES